MNEVIKQIKAKNGLTDVKVKYVNLEYLKTKVFVNNVILHKKLVETFRDSEIDAFSFTPKETRKPSILIKGLDADTPPEEIQEDIVAIIPDVKILKIVRFVTPNSKKLGVPLNIFSVQVDSHEDIKKLTNIKFILYQRIYWERKKQQEVIRCYRCQRFGHMGDGCAYNPRCVLCGEHHESSKCLIETPKEGRPKPKCANCKSLEHTASYKGCPEFKKYKDRKERLVASIREKISNRREEVNRTINNYVRPRVSLADSVRGRKEGVSYSSYSSQGATNVTVQEIINESKNLFNKPLTEIIKKIKEFWPKYKKIESQEDKIIEYLSFVATLID